MTRRTERVNELIREEISWVLSHEVRDPRLEGIVSVTRVSVTSDLKFAKVFVSIMGSEEEKGAGLEALAAASGFFHRRLMKRLTIRHVPELDFRGDNSIEQGIHIIQLIEQVAGSENSSGC